LATDGLLCATQCRVDVACAFTYEGGSVKICTTPSAFIRCGCGMKMFSVALAMLSSIWAALSHSPR
jgi:hypothetical protein